MAGIKGQMKYKRGDMVGVYEFIDRIKRPHGYRYMLHCTVCGTTKIVSSSIVSMRATANRCTCREHYTSRTLFWLQAYRLPQLPLTRLYGQDGRWFNHRQCRKV